MSGSYERQVCQSCSGSGIDEVYVDVDLTAAEECRECGGEGVVGGEWVEDAAELEVAA